MDVSGPSHICGAVKLVSTSGCSSGMCSQSDDEPDICLRSPELTATHPHFLPFNPYLQALGFISTTAKRDPASPQKIDDFELLEEQGIEPWAFRIQEESMQSERSTTELHPL
jgi:hypothetical protein